MPGLSRNGEVGDGNSLGTARVSGRKAGMTSSQHGPYVLGYTHATMGATKGREAARWSKSQKSILSTDCGLQLDHMKAESLVTVDQQCDGEYVPGPCTHRPSRHLSLLHPKSLAQPAREGGAEGVAGKGDEVVTR